MNRLSEHSYIGVQSISAFDQNIVEMFYLLLLVSNVSSHLYTKGSTGRIFELQNLSEPVKTGADRSVQPFQQVRLDRLQL